MSMEYRTLARLFHADRSMDSYANHDRLVRQRLEADSTFTTGIFNESASSASEGTIVIAPVGQCRAQLPHATLSRSGTQFFSTHTA